MKPKIKYIFLHIVLLIYALSTSYINAQNTHQNTLDSIQISRIEQDSLRIQELEVQIQELKLNEIAFINEKSSKGKADSIKKADQKRQIDSLRLVTRGFPVIVEGDTLFSLYSRRGGVMPADRAKKTTDMIVGLGKKLTMKPDSIYVFESEFVTDIMSGDQVIITLTDQDGLWQNTTREDLAHQYLQTISNKVSELHAEYGLQQKIKSFLLLILVIFLQILLIYLTNKLFKKIGIYIKKFTSEKLKTISIFNYEFLNNEKQERILMVITNIIKYILIIIQLIIFLSVVFSIFPETEKYAYLLLSYIWNPAKDILKAIASFLPNLFKIVLIYLFFRYAVRGLKYIANEISAERLKIKGFYPDWAMSTYQILRFLLYSFMLIMIWPLLPNSSSPVFQGVSVFIGLIISLGSTTVIGNLMAGLVITYMRGFKIGDQIKLNDTVGNVIEKTPFVIRIRTSKNEIITIPNSFIMSSQTTNYSASARDRGIVVYSDITVGYEIPWQKVKQLLIDAATQTDGIMLKPEPFVLVKELADFYCCYQINAYTDRDLSMPRVYSELHQNIIDKFNEAGIEIMSPHFYAKRDGNDIMMPSEYKRK